MSDKLKALAIDLDGTLLVGDSLSARNQQAVKAAYEKGYHIIIATARWRQLAEAISQQIGLKGLPIIACSGAQVYCTETASDIYDTRLPQDFVERLYGICNKNRCIASATVDSHTWLKVEPAPPAGSLSEELRWVSKLPASSELPRIATVQGGNTIDRVRELHQQGFQDLVNVFDSIGPSGRTVITITAKNADKGIALKKACDHIGIAPSEVVAFGDAENDIAMFRLAGESVAMGQAEADIKNAADHVTASNENDGVAEFIENRLL
ncbi:MAG: Cof-type HAD-IIB family hydrolase [Candidatus Azotimanducaceae bacterium WSBS_2022_MAG_OTU7]